LPAAAAAAVVTVQIAVTAQMRPRATKRP